MLLQRLGLIYCIICTVNLCYGQNVDEEFVPPVIRSVSALEDNNCLSIEWTMKEPDSVSGYVISRKIGDDFVIVGTINDPYKFSYTDDNSTPEEIDISKNCYTYKISSISKDDISESYQSISHTTSRLEKVTFDSCEFANTLHWFPYKIQGKNEAKTVEIYTKYVETGTFVKIDEIDGKDTFYVHKNVKPNNSYAYYIKTNIKNRDIDSKSNTMEIETKTNNYPENFWITRIENTEDRKLEIFFWIDPSFQNASYKIYESNTLQDTFQVLTTVYPSESIQSYIDINSSIKGTSFYKIVSFTSCDAKSNESAFKSNIPSHYFISSIEATTDNQLQIELYNDTVLKASYSLFHSDSPNGPFNKVFTTTSQNMNTIWLDNNSSAREINYYKILPEDDGIDTASVIKNNIVLKSELNSTDISKIHLTWFGYNGQYPIYMSLFKIVDNNSPELVFSTHEAINEYYFDLASELNGSDDKESICFYLENELTDSLDYITTIISNKTCNDISGIQKFPTAINPVSSNEVNRKFNPILGQTDFFLFIVYDRWGNEVFKTQTQGIGWDGKGKNGNLVMQGAYVFYIQYTIDGEKFTRNGTISVIYP